VLHDLVSRLPLIIIAVLLGVVFAWQTPINAEAARRLGSPVLAGVLSISLSLVLVVTFALMTVRAKPDWSEIASAPWWTWIGGIAGAVFVVAAAVIVPKTGSVLFLLAVVLGQMLGAIVADTYGMWGLAVQPISLTKLVGVSLVLAGAVVFNLSN
jgi:transporter family-2 protein